VTRGISQSVTASLHLEVEGIMALTQGQTTRNLIQLFFQQERAKKLSVAQTFQSADSGDFPFARRNTGLESPVNPQVGKPALHCAVVGAGVMGAGIAQWLSCQRHARHPARHQTGIYCQRHVEHFAPLY